MKKIVIIGPESTGKSSLCTELAGYFQGVCCPEYAREYLLAHGMHYTYEDLLTIARGQLDLEDKHASMTKDLSPSGHPAMLFIDTDMYVMKVWCEFVFSNCHLWIMNQIAKREYDLYLLCNTDLPWVQDELREYPDLETREKLYHMYKDLMINQDTPWAEISGNYEERIKRARDAVRQWII